MGDDVREMRRRDQQGGNGWKHILGTLVFKSVWYSDMSEDSKEVTSMVQHFKRNSWLLSDELTAKGR